MNCPRDNAVLRSLKKGQLEVNVCDTCNGFSVLLEQESARSLETQLKSHFSKVGEDNRVATLVSPYTGASMSRFLYRGIQLDYCPATHSIWFDRGEYSKMFQSPTVKENSVKSDSSGRVSKAWEVVDNVGTSIDVIGFVGDLLGEIVSGVDLF